MLRIVSSVSKEKAAVSRSVHREETLVSKITGVEVTVTSLSRGTVAVTAGAYRDFRRLCISRKMIRIDETQSFVIAELMHAFLDAVVVGKDQKELKGTADGDRRNWLYMNLEERIMFVVSAGNKLLTIYDRRESPDPRKPEDGDGE